MRLMRRAAAVTSPPVELAEPMGSEIVAAPEGASSSEAPAMPGAIVELEAPSLARSRPRRSASGTRTTSPRSG